ncbi:putative bifunctional diguanylate cyclase/phosphodiesterase [Ureibacillus endophyticus]|uniref:Phosphodiesterase n=1 Tax=Ureibacillus endophyticus TaxID=1978490 RepID=A0A494Z967_9BACL|nr:GGDEF domain-containing phosphodiesterase [Lysinibacillus endophyticus]RKQ19117.1 phosphodiesterase [Lysinibacillus endophyticus]
MGNSYMPLNKEQLFSFLCNISEQYHIGIAIVDINDPNYPIVFLNNAFLHLTGYDKDELIGRNITTLKGQKTSEESQEEFEYHLLHKKPFRLNILHYRKDKVAFWNHIACEPIKDNKGHIQYAVLHCNDITESMLGKMLSKLEHEVYTDLEKGVELVNICKLITKQVERYYIRDIFSSIHFVTSPDEINPIASGSLSLEWVMENHKMDINSTASCNERAIYIQKLTNHSNQYIESDVTCWTKPIYNNEQQLLGYFSMYLKNHSELRQADIDFLNKLSPIIGLSIKYAEQKQQLQKLAYFDLSSGIPNYNYFYTKLKEWAEEGIKGHILLIQPREYSSIVDLFGRSIGDELIGQLIQRLEKHYNIDNIIYGRFSNSTFIIATKSSSEEIDNLVKRLFEITSTPFSIAKREIFISLKIGIANFDETISIDESIRRSDIALTKSRNQKDVEVAYFEPETDEKIQRELEIVNQLTYGLQNDEFTIHLQPKVNLITAEIEGFEALARWYSPVLGPISPAEFIPIAEHTGKISQLDNVILKKVLKFQNERKTKGLKIVPISVNISPVHFYRESFVEDFISYVNKYEISPEFIKIEVTESVELFDYQKAKEILSELRKFGYESSIDDFGVGFSSLSYLQQLPFSEIKIDRSFINGIEDNAMYAVVQTIVQLASNLKMHAVAEGIETLEQYQLLQKMGCRTGQGYYFHKPMAINEAERLLDTIK